MKIKIQTFGGGCADWYIMLTSQKIYDEWKFTGKNIHLKWFFFISAIIRIS